MRSRAISTLTALIVSATCAVGCGGGRSSSPSQKTVVRSGVMVLPSDGSVTITGQTDSSITLSGAVPSMQPGAVLVSGTGQGLLRKVVSTMSSGGNIIVQTTPATLEDVFQEAHIAVHRDLGPGDFVASRSVKPIGSRSTPSSDPLDIAVNLNRTLLDHNGKKVELSGTATLKVGVDIAIDIGLTGISHARFVPNITAQLDATVTGSVEADLLDEKVLLTTLVGEPIDIQVGFVPVVLIPEIDVYAHLQGKVGAGLSLQSTAAVTVGAGVEYNRGSGWRRIDSIDRTATIMPVPSLFASFTAGVTPFSPEIGLKIEGITGPYVRCDCPTLQVEFKRTTDTPGTDVTASAIFKGSAGWKVDILGHTLGNIDYPTTVQAQLDLFHHFNPDNGGLDVGIQ
jgi:hypothetical protein